MKKRVKRLLIASGVLIFVIAWFALLWFIPVQSIIEYLGIRSTYGVVFLLSVLTGGSSFTAGALYSVIIALAQGGLSIIGLSIVSGIGSMAGDSLYYVLGNKSHEALSKKYKKRLIHVEQFLEKYPGFTPLIVFCYAAFIPMPNDIMTISLGLSNYSYKKMVLPLFLGNIVYFAILLWGATHAWNLFVPGK
jgi:membrane protein YqaA with SNARE-associated domain